MLNRVGSLFVGLQNGTILTYDTESQQESNRIDLGKGPVKFICQTKRSVLVVTQDGFIHRFFKGAWVSSPKPYADAKAVLEREGLLVLLSTHVVKLNKETLGMSTVFSGLTSISEEESVLVADPVACIAVVSPYLIIAKDRVVSVKTKKGIIALNVCFCVFRY